MVSIWGRVAIVGATAAIGVGRGAAVGRGRGALVSIGGRVAIVGATAVGRGRGAAVGRGRGALVPVVGRVAIVGATAAVGRGRGAVVVALARRVARARRAPQARRGRRALGAPRGWGVAAVWAGCGLLPLRRALVIGASSLRVLPVGGPLTVRALTWGRLALRGPLTLRGLSLGAMALRGTRPTVTRALSLSLGLAGARALARPRRQALGGAPEVLFLLHRGQLVQDGLRIHQALGRSPGTGGHEVGRERGVLVGLPDLLAVRATLHGGLVLREEVREVVDVADQQLARVLVLGRVHRLWEVDDHRPAGAHQHVEVREVAVHHARADHLHHLGQQVIEALAGLLGAQRHVAQARGRRALGVLDQLHDQHAVHELERLGHAHARVAQAMDDVHLGGAPGLLVHGAAVLAALLHGAGVARAAHATALGVLGAVLEAAVDGVLVDLGDAQLAARLHQVDLRLFAAHQRADHLGDDALGHEGLEAVGHAHGAPCALVHPRSRAIVRRGGSPCLWPQWSCPADSSSWWQHRSMTTVAARMISASKT